MPIYSYECEDANCRHVTNDFCHSMPRIVQVQVPCEKCGKNAFRSYQAEVNQHHAELEYVSLNAGVMPNQVGEANKQYADLGVKFREHDGAMVCPNRSTYFKALERRGLFNKDEIRSPRTSRTSDGRGGIFS